MKLSPKARRILAVLLIGVAAWFLADTVIRNWQELRDFDWKVDPLLLGLSLVAHVAVLAWGVFVWGRVLRGFEHPPVPFPTLLRIWFLSSLARYVPGKVWQFLAVAQLGRGAGLSGAVLLASLLVHTGLSLLSAVVLSAYTLAGQHFPDVSPLAVGFAVTVLAMLLVHPALLNHALAIIPRLLRKDVVTWRGSWLSGAGLLLLSVGSWIAYGGAFYLFIASLTDISARSLPALSGVNALSFVVGYLAIVAPAGMGVRELTMATLLLPIVPAGVAAVLAIASRLWTVAAEIVGGGMAVAVRGPVTERVNPGPP